VHAISLLPLLEPLAGVAFAINLAYLNLERFRYRRLIREQAKAQYAHLREKEYFDAISDLKEVQMLRDLSGLKDFDNMGSDPIDPAEEVPRSNRKVMWVEWIYKIVFQHHLDLKVCRVLAAVAILLVYFGVMHALGRHSYVAPMFNAPEEAHFWADVLFITLLIPLGFAALGNWMVGNLKAKAHEAFKQMETIAGKLAARAHLQSDPAQGPGDHTPATYSI
jgi:hypothetical protein